MPPSNTTARGRRTEKVAAGLTHNYVYDAEDIVEERITGSSSDTIRYHHGVGIDEPLARTNGSSVTTYYLADHLGSIVQETNASGAVVLEREYDPWGELVQGSNASGYSYTGREWDSETSLFFYRARYYSADAGRFLSDDPIGFRGGVNFVGYVENSPASRFDPTGLDWRSFLQNAAEGAAVGAIGAAVVGAVAVGAAAVGVSAAVITTGLAVVAVVGVVASAIDISAAASRGDWDTVGYDVGAIAGGIAVGGASGRAVATRVNRTDSPPWSIKSDFAQGYDRNYPGGSVGQWWATGPNPGSAAGAMATGGAGIASAGRSIACSK